MDVKLKHINPENLCLGGISLLFGTYLSYHIYKKIEKKNKDGYKSSESKNDSEEDIQNQLKECKKRGYVILISTIVEYKKKNPSGNFKDFMKEMWPEDYEIILKSENKDSSCKRDYSRWEKIFNNLSFIT